MLDQVPGEFVASLLAELGVKAAKGVLGYFGTRDATSTKSRKNTPDLTAEEVGVEPAEYSGETQQFLARQRLHHRIDLAKAKWAWLVAATYYHPTRGRTQDIALEWHPRKIAGQFTVSDFASRDLPHESYIGESAPSDVRLSIIQGRITIAAALRDTLGEIEGALAQSSSAFDLPKPPWNDQGVELAWASLISEIGHRQFVGLPQFNSFCGFKDLWSVRDTPAFGIRSRDTGALAAAYGYVAELAWYLAQHDPELGHVYAQEFEKGKELPHQWALRKVGVKVLDAIWQKIGPTIAQRQPFMKVSNKRLQSTGMKKPRPR